MNGRGRQKGMKRSWLGAWWDVVSPAIFLIGLDPEQVRIGIDRKKKPLVAVRKVIRSDVTSLYSVRSKYVESSKPSV